MFRSVAFNTAISFGGRIIAAALGLFSLALTTRLLGVEGFGLYSTALAWAYIFSFIADLGLYSLMVREISRAKGEEERRIASHIFTLRLASLLVFLGFGILIALLSPWTFGLTALAVALASLQYLFLSTSQVLMGIFQKYLYLGVPALADIAGRLVTVSALLFLFYQNRVSLGYEIILFIGALGAGVISVVNLVRARSLVSFRIAFDFSYWRELLAHTFPIALSIILTAFYFKLDTLFIAFFRGQEEVGLYNAAYRILENMIFFPAAFVGILMPQLSQFAIKAKERFASLFQGIFDTLLIMTFPITLGIVFESKAIMEIIGGGEFLASSRALEVLALGMFMIFFGSLFSQGLIALDKQKRLAWIYFFGAIFNIIANFFVVPFWGYVGAAVTTLFTETLVTVLMIRAIEKTIFLKLRFPRALPVAVAAGIMSGVLYLTSLPLFVSIVLAAFIYIAALWAIGGITREDMRLISQPPPQSPGV